MTAVKSDFTLLITTHNRLNDLKLTLANSSNLLKQTKCVICDDGSTDDTASFIKQNYPEIQLIQNAHSKGLIFSRNRLLSLVTTKYAISLDDDAHLVTQEPLNILQKHFDENPNCGVIALRIFWGLSLPINSFSNETTTPVQGFVGCGHVWRMKAWHDIPNYPDWFVFYGEEDFAAYQLFKKNWGVHYFPEVLVQHRVDVKGRKSNLDYTIRLRRSLRSGWYLLFLFTPIYLIPRKLTYSIYMQLKLKVLKGDKKALKALVLALFDVVIAIPKLIRTSNRLTKSEFNSYNRQEETRIYWKAEETR